MDNNTVNTYYHSVVSSAPSTCQSVGRLCRSLRSYTNRLHRALGRCASVGIALRQTAYHIQNTGVFPLQQLQNHTNNNAIYYYYHYCHYNNLRVSQLQSDRYNYNYRTNKMSHNTALTQ